MGTTLETVDPRSTDVQAILVRHLTFTNATSPAEHVHALNTGGLLDPTVTMVGAWQDDGVLVGVGAIKQLDRDHAELKSMHVVEEARGQGFGRVIVAHLLRIAEERGYRRVSLETGAMEEFAAARALYASVGFVPCPPFGSYTLNEYSSYMTRELPAPDGRPEAAAPV
jgi:putative acetyltransferase